MQKLLSEQKTSWQWALIHAVTHPRELLELLKLDPSLLPQMEIASKLFPLKVPRGFIARMRKGDINDPLLKQILPMGAENEKIIGYVKDPLKETAVNPAPGLLHKYKGRVLLTPIGTCAINCRYCFRRHFPYSANNPGTSGWNQALKYIAADTSLHEVILSGGDPLVMSDEHLHDFTEKISRITHLKRLRIHSRIPVVLPERITSEFIAWINQVKLQIVLVLHCNHPNEIDHTVITAIETLRKEGVTLLNQAVLLKGVNDDVDTLISLSETLFAIGVQPYYLHILDKVEGTSHFDLPLATARKLHKELTHRLSGYLVPKLVVEEPGAASKLVVV